MVVLVRSRACRSWSSRPSFGSTSPPPRPRPSGAGAAMDQTTSGSASTGGTTASSSLAVVPDLCFGDSQNSQELQESNAGQLWWSEGLRAPNHHTVPTPTSHLRWTDGQWSIQAILIKWSNTMGGPMLLQHF
ncbi:uncharacterized protein [Triticum aestivum]|uniref:uncharacterized protein n=1 Tax=Triticum aestivum TaxID=4565 RepID=UPI000844A9DA|nr:uncharacterized protein LOC109773132 isoform X1 [Aegilops tauschii subsp. strangulata]XP_044375191.1 uncharacterized protein LOC123097490 [Triticum aestivum]